MRLIDADALDDVVMRLNFEENRGITRAEYKLIDSVLFEFPTLKVRKKGRWIPKDDGRYHCSLCDDIAPKGYGWNFCPNCGCRMI